MESILKAIKKKKIPINPAVVISNKPNAKGLAIAKKMGIQTEVIESSKYKGKRLQYDKEIISTLKKYKVTPSNGLVCLAGFMRIISPYFIKEYKNKILNIHPALLPAFPGLDAQKQAIEFGSKFSGCTVHFVDEGVDTGPIIIQEIVKINNNDTEKSLSKKILVKEHEIYPKAVELFAKKKISIKGRKVKISN
ncbi:MAG: Phosphoribosylglycinamide formyltransferase [Candidatus Nitrosopelagicus brevis]|nr:MAG: phosphoribosylglycinamide formyltransferase [Candidatus Nitrosopelagicus sp.]CAI8179015.1 MAG: Phosphoribosylglycinamide formyltransferase [Candidatus Nitrosopelagicus brevis]|tara:strand:+ start:369 stop:947 length:579 start_codon:yes stop_codon:yes gene_type:complete